MIDIQMDGIYLDNGCLVKEAGIQPDDARENTIAYQILRAHSTSEEPFLHRYLPQQKLREFLSASIHPL